MRMKFDKYLDETRKKTKVYSDRDIQNIVEESLMDFWARVAELVPDAESGDIDPAQEIKVNKVLHQAVKSWIAFNTYSDK